MKILHVCLACFYIDGYSYQENMLPKYHKKMGHDVSILASLMTFDEKGNQAYLENPSSYVNEHGIPVKRLSNMKPKRMGRLIRKYTGTYEALREFDPEVIFIHGLQFVDISAVVKYAKTKKDVKIFVDNHSDFSNSATNWVSKNILHKLLWRHCAKKINPYTIKFFGVLPARVDFLANVYKLPKEKIELLVMGTDDELVEKSCGIETRRQIRNQYGICEKDFLLINGGKIDQWKKQTLLLMDAVNKLSRNDVKLIVFGSVTDDLKHEVERRCSDKVQYIGWVKSENSYEYFAASDLAVFPGRHSVFWEQVAGQGIPMLVKFWDGTTHVDCGGNVRFLHNDSVDEIKENIEQLVFTEQYSQMLEAANKAKTSFLYSDIAKRSIEQ